MRNALAWTPSKFTRDRRGRWRANRGAVPAASWLIADVLARAYAAAIDAHASGRLVDLGCGRVPLYEMYRDKVVEVICVDWPGSLHQIAHVDHLGDLNAELDLEPESFDTVIATDVIEHLHTPQALFNGAARLLRPGGKLIVGVPFLYWIHEGPHDYYRYTRFALVKMTEDAGLKVVSLAPLAGAPEVLADIAGKSLGGYPRLARVVHWVSRGLLKFAAVRRLSEATREALPLAYVLVASKPETSQPHHAVPSRA